MCPHLLVTKKRRKQLTIAALALPAALIGKTPPTQADWAQLHFALARRAFAVILTKFISEAPVFLRGEIKQTRSPNLIIGCFVLYTYVEAWFHWSVMPSYFQHLF